jgi:glycosyltransferase involved in cell wall biosynthesis
MSDQPLVSIVIPCYNAEKYVGEAIRSALDQTYHTRSQASIFSLLGSKAKRR